MIILLKVGYTLVIWQSDRWVNFFTLYLGGFKNLIDLTLNLI